MSPFLCPVLLVLDVGLSIHPIVPISRIISPGWCLRICVNANALIVKMLYVLDLVIARFEAIICIAWGCKARDGCSLLAVKPTGVSCFAKTTRY